MEYDFLIELIPYVLSVVGVAAFVKGVFEYSLNHKLKRAEQFLIMEKEFEDNPSFQNICTLLDQNSSNLRMMPFEEKREFLGFFEEIALMMQSKLISKNVAYYMFGYYSIQCWRSDDFFYGVARNSIYWKLFKSFAEEMIEIENDFSKINPKKLKF